MIICYIDPGSGSVLIQVLIVGFATVVVFFKNIKNKILHFLGKKDEDETNNIDK